MAVFLSATITACHKIQPADSFPANTMQPAPTETQDAEIVTEAQTKNTMTAYHADGSTVILEDCGDETWRDANGSIYYLGEDGILRARGSEDLYTDIPVSAKTDTSAPTAQNTSETETEIGRQDGERFEEKIMVEGMQETVRYEHIRNDMLGFEMDYDYESFVRHSESVCDRFVSIYDDPEDPLNYLEVQYSAEDADTVAASVSESLSDDYDIIQEPYKLDRAGSCIRIDASNAKGNGGTPDLLQMVYIIPASDGCRIATAHYSFESAEGFGRRFAYMMNTLEVIGRYVDYADSTDVGELPAEDSGEWTGADFGELPSESGITAEMAYEGVYNYCHSVYDWSIAEDNPSMMYLEMGEESETGYQVIFHSYTGALVYFYVDKSDGTTRMTEYVPTLNIENEAGSISLYDYLTKQD